MRPSSFCFFVHEPLRCHHHGPTSPFENKIKSTDPPPHLLSFPYPSPRLSALSPWRPGYRQFRESRINKTHCGLWLYLDCARSRILSKAKIHVRPSSRWSPGLPESWFHHRSVGTAAGLKKKKKRIKKCKRHLMRFHNSSTVSIPSWSVGGKQVFGRGFSLSLES